MLYFLLQLNILVKAVEENTGNLVSQICLFSQLPKTNKIFLDHGLWALSLYTNHSLPCSVLYFIPIWEKHYTTLPTWGGGGMGRNWFLYVSRSDLALTKLCLHCLLWSPINENIRVLSTSGLLQLYPLPYPSLSNAWQNDRHTKSFLIVVEISHPNGFL